MRPRAGGDDFAVDGVEEPAQLVVLSVVAGIAQRHAKVKGQDFVQRIDGLDGSVQNLRGRHQDGRIGRRLTTRRRAIRGIPADIERLRRRLLVGNVNVGNGEVVEQARGVGRTGVIRREIAAYDVLQRAADVPGAVTVSSIKRYISRMQLRH